MSAENLKIWNALKTTDPVHTKKFQRAGGFRGTSVKPIYSTLKMTEQFGPAGKGWGMGEPWFQVVTAGEETLVYCTVALWWEKPDQVVYGVGGDKVAVKRSDGKLFTDDEAFKKSYTDALSNAMKQIGVAADIHMGQHDDDKYVSEIKRQIEAENGNGKAGRPPLTGPLNRSQLVEKLREIDKDLMACSDIDEFDSCLRSYSEVTEQAARDIPEAWLGPVEDGTAWKDAFEAMRQKLLDKGRSAALGEPFPTIPPNPTGREQAEWCKAITERMEKCRDTDELEALEKMAEATRLRCTAQHKGRPYGDILKERFQRRNLALAGNTAAA